MEWKGLSLAVSLRGIVVPEYLFERNTMNALATGRESKTLTTLSSGSLGSRVDEERSQLRDLV